MSEDYYQILGVKKDASDDQIKKAFRKKAKKYHPDKNQGDDEAEVMFKKINEANEVLSDSEKRSRYDRFGDANYEPPRVRRRVEPINVRVPITVYEAFSGTKRRIEVFRKNKCNKCDGVGHGKDGKIIPCPGCGGAGVVNRVVQMGNQRMSMTQTCGNCMGAGYSIQNPCSGCGGKKLVIDKNSVSFDVPKGAIESNGISIMEEGNWDYVDSYGPVNMIFAIEPDDFFEVSGHDMRCEVPISIKQAIFGGKVTVPSLHGNISIKIPKKTNGQKLFKVKGKGMRKGFNSNSFGDLYVSAIIDVPNVDSKLSKDFDESNFSYENISKYEKKQKEITSKIKKSSSKK